jgi:hypothetical protein
MQSTNIQSEGAKMVKFRELVCPECLMNDGESVIAEQVDGDEDSIKLHCPRCQREGWIAIADAKVD